MTSPNPRAGGSGGFLLSELQFLSLSHTHTHRLPSISPTRSHRSEWGKGLPSHCRTDPDGEQEVSSARDSMYMMAILNQEDDIGAVCSKETQGRVSSLRKCLA